MWWLVAGLEWPAGDQAGVAARLIFVLDSTLSRRIWFRS